MPARDSEVQMLIERLYLSMSRQLRSNNPVFNPAICTITHLEFADLAALHLSSIVVSIQNRLTDDEHEVDVQCIIARNERHACHIVSAAPKEIHE